MPETENQKDAVPTKRAQAEERASHRKGGGKVLVARREFGPETRQPAAAVRSYRPASDRPRPDLPANAPANRTRPQVAVTLPPDLVDQLNAAAEESGVPRSQLIERAIRNYLGS